MLDEMRNGPTPFLVAIALTIFAMAGDLAADDDWPQWRGPSRSGQAPAFEPPDSWAPELRLVWTAEVGNGDSSPLVADDRAFIFSRLDEKETVSSYSMEDGSLVWRVSYESPFKALSIVREHGAGPFSTPVLADGRLFTLGITETLSAWDAASGEQVWQKRFDDDFKRTQNFYGASTAPMVADGRLIVHLGGPDDGALMAFDPATGEELWRWAGDGPGYGAPVVLDLEGVRQVVTLTQRNVVGVELASGRLLWQEPFLLSFFLTSLTPIYHEGLVILSGTDVPTRAYEVTRRGETWDVEEAWSNPQVSMQYSSPVLAGGKLFAFSQENKGQLVALDPATGTQVWAGPGRRGDNAWLLANGDFLVVVYTDAEMEVLSAKDDEPRPLAQYTLADSSIWAHPALLQRHILIKDASHLRLWEIPPE